MDGDQSGVIDWSKRVDVIPGLGQDGFSGDRSADHAGAGPVGTSERIQNW
jgi:hypothetical protein